MQNKKILILSTGGTIAGSGDDDSKGSCYQAGVLSGSDLLASLPPMQVALEIYEIAQIDSIEMNAEIWEKMLLQLNKDYDGFVVTHGTDTMEESSFVIDLIYKKNAPVVFVGAMRPSNAIGSDGIKNLCNAIALASSPKSQGVMVLMNDKIYDPKWIYKAHTYNLDAFKSCNGAEMGYVLDGEVSFFFQPKRYDFPFVLQDLHSLPKVEIIYIYAGIQDLPFCTKEIEGFVIAGCGAGNIPSKIKQELIALEEKGVLIVASSRGSEGFVKESEFIPSFGLNVAKSRILLALCIKHCLTKQQTYDLFSRF